MIFLYLKAKANSGGNAQMRSGIFKSVDEVKRKSQPFGPKERQRCCGCFCDEMERNVVRGGWWDAKLLYRGDQAWTGSGFRKTRSLSPQSCYSTDVWLAQFIAQFPHLQNGDPGTPPQRCIERIKWDNEHKGVKQLIHVQESCLLSPFPPAFLISFLHSSKPALEMK